MPKSQFHLERVTLSNGETLNFTSKDIVLLVGPNNSGKSTFLSDIKSYIRDSSGPRKMLLDLKFSFDGEAALKSRIESVFNIADSGDMIWILNADGKPEHYISFDKISQNNFALRHAADAFAILLNAETRLRLSNPTNTIDISSQRPKHPYHHFMLDREKLRRFAGIIRDAFGFDFSITRIGNPIRGYIGAAFDNHIDSLEEDKKIPSKGEAIERQGDGVRSYVGIAAELIGAPYPVTLLDEPEAFLHPPQAKKLGRLVVSKLPSSCQAFVATHSSDFLQGVLHSRSSRVRVLRLDRAGENLRISSLHSHQLVSAVAHPSIANTNLLDSLFFTQTVICEGDSDCSLFDWLIRETADDEIKRTDRFWFATGGKHQTPKIAEMLSAFGVDFRVILDLDALADWELLEKLAAFKEIDIDTYKNRIQTALSVLQRPPIGSLSSEIRSTFEQANVTDEESERQLFRDVQRVMEKARRSHPLKQYGVSAFRNGQERVDVEKFLQLLAENGIILLPKGEIESYVPGVGLHGPGWVSAVLNDHAAHDKNLRQLVLDISHGIT